MLFIDPTGPITLRAESGHTTLYAPGAWNHGTWELTPLADLPSEVREAAVEHWTSARVDSYRAATQPVEMSPEEIIEQFRAAIQSHVDQTAKARRYDNGVSLASYVASSNPAWAAEAQAFVAWRDAVWAYAYTELDKVLAAEREQPSVEEFIDELPVIAWPEAD